jgi:tetratricopeptide (TPR) repeat protein
MEKAVVKLQMRTAKLRKEAEGAKAVGDADSAASLTEEADQLARDEAPILARLGMAQLGMGMPANAERNFRRAVELEGDDKPSLQLLAQVLTQTGRAHEVPPMLQEVVEKNPQSPQAHVNYAMSLMQAGKKDEATKAFEDAIANLEDSALPKRFYAPVLAQDGDLDRAMDLYEDVLEVAPNEVPVLLEYAQTLQNANRAFEVPKVLRDVLNTDPDANTKAHTQAWLIRLEQPKRVEAVDAAAKKLQDGDADGALKELKPLKNWLGDFFELWMHLADAYNRVGDYKEAENAAQQLLGIFPGCEPGYALLAAALHGQERDQDAYNFLRMAMANNPSSLTIALNLAQSCMWTGNIEEGRALTRQIREATGNDENIGKILDSIEDEVV